MRWIAVSTGEMTDRGLTYRPARMVSRRCDNASRYSMPPIAV